MKLNLNKNDILIINIKKFKKNKFKKIQKIKKKITKAYGSSKQYICLLRYQNW